MMYCSVMTQAYSKKEIPSSPNRSRTYDLPITISDALPLSYRRLVEEIVRKTLVEKMNIPEEDVERIRFERVHRMRTRKASSKPRPVIAKFSFYQDKEFVWSFVKNLKGSGIGMSNDFPKEIDEIHEKLYPILKQDRQSAYFKVDKLIITAKFTEVRRLKIFYIMEQ